MAAPRPPTHLLRLAPPPPPPHVLLMADTTHTGSNRQKKDPMSWSNDSATAADAGARHAHPTPATPAAPARALARHARRGHPPMHISLCATAAGQDPTKKGQSGQQGKVTCNGDANKRPFNPENMVRVRCSRGTACKRHGGPLMQKWRFTNEGVERTKGFVCSACGGAAAQKI